MAIINGNSAMFSDDQARRDEINKRCESLTDRVWDALGVRLGVRFTLDSPLPTFHIYVGDSALTFDTEEQLSTHLDGLDSP